MLVGRQRPRPGFVCAQPASKGKRCAFVAFREGGGVQPDSPKAHPAHLILNSETARFFLLKLETGDAMWNLSASQIKRSVPQVLSSPASQPASQHGVLKLRPHGSALHFTHGQMLFPASSLGHVAFLNPLSPICMLQSLQVFPTEKAISA